MTAKKPVPLFVPTIMLLPMFLASLAIMIGSMAYIVHYRHESFKACLEDKACTDKWLKSIGIE